MKHPRPEQIELGTPVHLTLDQLEPVDLPLELAIAPLVYDGVTHCLVVLADPFGESDELFQLTPRSGAQPRREQLGLSLAHHLREAECQLPGHLHTRKEPA